MDNEEKPTVPGMPLLSTLRARIAAAREEQRLKNRAAATATATAKEERAQELSTDGLNDDRYGTSTVRRVVHNPAIANTTATADVANVTHVPISKPVPAAAFQAAVPVIRDSTLAATTRRELGGLERGAAADSRREGSYPSTVVAALPTATVDANEVPLQGLATRVVQASLAAATGARAAPAPNVRGWDVRPGAIAKSQSLLRTLGSYDVLIIPHDMPRDAAEALASLNVPGGAAAYGWRFPDGHDAHELMPSYVRWLYPGGRDKTLVLFEQPDGPYTFGGNALTVGALSALERWMRREFGNELVDQAYKTMVAAGHVYLDPIADDFDPGENLDSVRVTTTRDDLDLATVAWTPQADEEHRTVPRYPDAEFKDRPREFEAGVLDAANAVLDPPPPANAAGLRVSISESNWMASYTWRVGRNTAGGDADLGDVLTWLADPDHHQPLPVRQFAMAFGTTGEPLYDLVPEDQRAESDQVRRNIRNVFGFSDEATLTVPVYDLARVAPAIAGVLLPTNIRRSATNLPGEMRDRCRSYAAKLHTAHIFTALEHGIWPDTLYSDPLAHGALVATLPDGLQPLAYVADADRSFLSASNWQLLESTLRLKGTTRRTAYVGYDVGGSWVVSDNGRVAVDDDKTNYAALDAALRTTWNYGGQVAASEPGNVVVLDRHGYVAPAGIAPVVQTRRRLRGLLLEAGMGADLIGAGSSVGFDAVRAV